MTGSQEASTSDSSQISPLPSSPHLAPVNNQLQPQTTSEQARPVLDIISESFSPFDHESIISDPYEAEILRDAKFETELSSMILDALIETHAWSMARPRGENLTVTRDLEPKINSVIEIEKEQEKTREQLAQFVAQMKSALATLTSGFL